MKLFCCCMSSPVQVISALHDFAGLSVKDGDVFIHPLGVRLRDDPELKEQAKKAKALVILNYADFVAQIGLMNNFPRTIFLLAPVLHCQRLQSSEVEYLDTIPAEISPAQVHRFYPLDTSRIALHDFNETYITTDLVLDNSPYLPKLIDAVRQGSLLNSLMTIIYRIGKASLQKQVKNACVRWMVENGSDFNLLHDMLTSLGVTSTGCEKVIGSIKDNGTIHLQILKKLREDKAGKDDDGTLRVDTKYVEKKYPDFDLYELRYILKLYAQIPYDANLAGKTLHEIYYGRERNQGKRGR